MKRILIALLVVVFSSAIGSAQDLVHYIKATKKWDNLCGPSDGPRDGLRVTFQNTAGFKISLKFIIERKDGKLDPEIHYLNPGEKTSGFECHGTGKLWIWAVRYDDKKAKLPSTKRIKANVRHNLPGCSQKTIQVNS